MDGHPFISAVRPDGALSLVEDRTYLVLVKTANGFEYRLFQTNNNPQLITFLNIYSELTLDANTGDQVERGVIKTRDLHLNGLQPSNWAMLWEVPGVDGQESPGIVQGIVLASQSPGPLWSDRLQCPLLERGYCQDSAEEAFLLMRGLQVIGAMKKDLNFGKQMRKVRDQAAFRLSQGYNASQWYRPPLSD